MDVQAILDKASDSISARRVFSEPIERDGATIILAAKVGGGGGGGEGPAGKEAQPQGSGTGYGFGARPAGAFVIRGGDVTWRPALDVNRIILGGQLVMVSALFMLRALFLARRASYTSAVRGIAGRRIARGLMRRAAR